jgi:hypothetical protein
MSAPQEANVTVQKAHNLVEHLIRELDFAHDHARTLARGRARALARAHAHAHALALARAHAHALDRTPDGTQAPARAPAPDLTRALALDLARARSLARDLTCARDFTRARDVTRDLTRDLDRVITRDLDLAAFIHRAHTNARQLANLLDHAIAQAMVTTSTAGKQEQRRRASRAARRVVRWSVRVLPAVAQARYRQEFEAELFDLRERSRWVQLRYAMRLLVRSVWLRRALRQSAPMVPARKRGW